MIDKIIEFFQTPTLVGKVNRKLFGEVLTPISLVNEILDGLPSSVWVNPDLRWLDPANGRGVFPAVVLQRLMLGLKQWQPDEEDRYKHIIEKMIHVCELQPENMAKYVGIFDPQGKYKFNTFIGSFLTAEFDKHAQEIWGVKKFDVIVGNPPYNAGIDLQFLSKGINISNRLIIVHPATWLLDRKGTKKYNNIKKNLDQNLVAVKCFNGNLIFKIGLFVPCAIINWHKNHNNTCAVQYFDERFTSNIWEITKFGENWETKIKPVITKLETWHLGNMWAKRLGTKNLEGKHYCQIAAIRGHVNTSAKSTNKTIVQSDFYTLVMKDSSRNEGIRNDKVGHNGRIIFEFDTLTERENFLEYCKTDFVRFCLSIYKNSQNNHRGELKLIPWMDFTKKWTDEGLYAEFKTNSRNS